MFPDGLLRIPMGWVDTILGLGCFFNPRRAQPRTFSDTERAALIASRRNVWISFATMQRAKLRHGVGVDELVVTSADGRKKRFLWSPNLDTFRTLQQVLTQTLGSQLSTPRRLGIDVPPWLDTNTFAPEWEIIRAVAGRLKGVLAMILYGAATHRQEFIRGKLGPVTLELLVIMDTDDEQVVQKAHTPLKQILTTIRGFELTDFDDLYMRFTFVSRDLREVESQLIATVAQDGLLIWARGPVPQVLAAVAMRAPLLNPYHWSYER